MHALVIGGTSGLGHELARDYHEAGYDVTVTGRREFNEPGLDYQPFEIAGPDLPQRMGKMVMQLPEVDSLVYAAGYYQEGRIDALTDTQIEAMIDVGGRGLLYCMREILARQQQLDELVTITSTSQFTPRQKEPVYNLAKAGAAHFSNAMAEDGRVGKVLVAAPAGMKTDFWKGIAVDPEDYEQMLDPVWVADQIMELRAGDYAYRFAKILRKDPRVEIVETRRHK